MAMCKIFNIKLKHEIFKSMTCTRTALEIYQLDVTPKTEQKHTWLIEDLTTISIQVLLNYQQWLGRKCHFFKSTHCK